MFVGFRQYGLTYIYQIYTNIIYGPQDISHGANFYKEVFFR